MVLVWTLWFWFPGDSHGPADHQVPLVGSVSQAHPRIREPAGRVDADVAALIRSHRIDHVKDHLKQNQQKSAELKN